MLLLSAHIPTQHPPPPNTHIPEYVEAAAGKAEVQMLVGPQQPLVLPPPLSHSALPGAQRPRQRCEVVVAPQGKDGTLGGGAALRLGSLQLAGRQALLGRRLCGEEGTGGTS